MRAMISRTAVFVAALAMLLGGSRPGSPGRWAQRIFRRRRRSGSRRRSASETISWGEAERLDREAFLGLHALLERSFPRVHASLRREVVNEYSLLYTWPGTDPSQKPILLTDHFDVVPVVEETLGEWEHPPFDGAIADGFVWGRGSLDDKSGVLSILEAVEGLLAEGFAPRRTIYLAFGHDEEVGGDEGAGATAALLRERGIELEFTLDEGGAVVSDAVPGIERPVALIGIAEKGYVNLRVTARAPGGHSSMPPRSTAIGRLARAIQRIEEHPLPARVAGPAALFLDEIGGQHELPARDAGREPLALRTGPAVVSGTGSGDQRDDPHHHRRHHGRRRGQGECSARQRHRDGELPAPARRQRR